MHTVLSAQDVPLATAVNTHVPAGQVSVVHGLLSLQLAGTVQVVCAWATRPAKPPAAARQTPRATGVITTRSVLRAGIRRASSFLRDVRGALRTDEDGSASSSIEAASGIFRLGWAYSGPRALIFLMMIRPGRFDWTPVIGSVAVTVVLPLLIGSTCPSTPPLVAISAIPGSAV